MNDDDEMEFDETKMPTVEGITVKLRFPTSGGLVEENMSIGFSKGIFGNDEFVAKLKVTANGDNAFDGGEFLIDGDAEIPLTAWIGRLVAALKFTTNQMNKNPNSKPNKEEPIEEEYNYIFKRK